MEDSRNLATVPLIALGTLVSFGTSPECLVNSEWKKGWYSSKQPHP